MNKTFTLANLLLLAVLSVFLQNCNTQKTDEAKNTTLEAKPEPAATTMPEKLDGSKLLNALFVLPNGTERFTNISKSITDIPAAEGVAATDSTSASKTFTHNFTSLEDEFMDVAYYYQGSSINAISIDVFLNDPAEVNTLLASSVEHLRKKYGKNTLNDGTYGWTVNKSYNLTIKDVSEKLAPGLKLNFIKKGTFVAIE
jgi:hypothetical protein